MKIILDTELKKTVCPKSFFDSIRQLNEASKITGRTKEIELKEYLNSIIEECSKDIINEKDLPKKTRTRKTVENINVLGKTVEVKEK